MQDFKKLIVWQKAHELAVEVYRTTAALPRDEMFGLMSQMRRAGVSVPANIAEGCGRQGGADFGRFLQIAMGSASELEYHVILAEELGFLKKEDSASLNNRIIEVKRMITMLMQKVKVTSGQQQGCQQSVENLITEN